MAEANKQVKGTERQNEQVKQAPLLQITGC